MKSPQTIIKILLFPLYYILYSNFFFGFIHKNFIKNFHYKNIKIELDIENIPLPKYSSFLFKTYEYSDRKIVENCLNKKNKCIIIGGCLGFIASLAFKKTKNKILVFEINKKIIKNLKNNLMLNNCKFEIFDKNLTVARANNKKFDNFYLTTDVFGNSMYIKKGMKTKINNISSSYIKNFKNFNTLIIDGEGIEKYYIMNLHLFKNIKYLIFEMHYNIFSSLEIKKMFTILEKNNFKIIKKCFNSFFFKKFN